MAETIDMTESGAGTILPASRKGGLYRLVKEIDIADVVTANGQALAATDIIQVFDIPAGSNVVNGNLVIVTALDPCTVCTLDFGSGLDADQFVDGLDATSAGNGTPLDTAEYFAAADTLDITIATLTGVLSTGLVRAIAFVEDLVNK
jgi:hypothetical protein